MTAKPLKKCPECGKNKLVRLIGIGAGIIFKGSGFYETDYRSEGYKQAAKAEKDAAKPKKEEKSESKTGDTKAAKSDSTDSGAKKKTTSSDKPASAKSKKQPKK